MIRIGGVQGFSTVDYPGQLAAVVFLQGCMWSCVYCHNQTLRPMTNLSAMTFADLEPFLDKRQGRLDAIVFSGGEPLLHKNLAKAMEKVKGYGYKVGMHTTGSVPDRLKECLPFVDWLGLDVKHLPRCQEEIVGKPANCLMTWESLKHLLASDVDYECRTTVHPDWIEENQLVELGRQLQSQGVKTWALQRYRSFGNPTSIVEELAGDWIGQRVAHELSHRFENLILRD